MMDDELAGLLAAIPRLHTYDETLQELLDRLTAATAQLPGCAAASATLVLDGAPTTPAFHGPAAYDLDQVQYRLGDGPCLAAHRENTVVRIDDTDEEDRWPEFTAESHNNGMFSVLSVPMSISDDSVGAINLYGTEEGAFGDVAEQMATVYAAQAAIHLANTAAFIGATQFGASLEIALRTRDI